MPRTPRDPEWKEKLHHKLHEDTIPHVHDFFDDAPVPDKLDEIGKPLWDIERKNICLN